MITLTGTGTNPRIGSVTGDTTNLTNTTSSPACGGAVSGEAVWSVTPDMAGTMKVDLGGSTVTAFDAVLSVRTKCDDDTSEVKCDDAGGNSIVAMSVTANTTYYIYVDGYGGEEGPYTLNVKVQQPGCGDGLLDAGEECDDGNVADNDGCNHLCKVESLGPADVCPGQAITLTQAGLIWSGSATGDTSTLGSNYSGTCATSSATTKDAVYTFTPTVDGTATVSLPTAAYDSVLYVRSGNCASGTQVDCDDSSGNGGESITFAATANTQYWVFVDGYDNESGTFTVDVRLTQAGCPNGIVETGEECDDGNTVDNDGCSHLCKFESLGAGDLCPGNALTLTASGADYVATASGSTAALGANYTGTCGSTSSSKDAVYSFSSPVAGIATATITTADFDSVIYGRGGECNPGTPLACKDKSGDGGDEIKFGVQANTNYWVFVDGYSGDSGSYTLDIKVSPAVCGNGVLEGEECDDGNVADGDGCDHLCKLEAAAGVDTCPGKLITLVSAAPNMVGLATVSTTPLTADYSGTCGGGTSKEGVFQFNSGAGGTATVEILYANYDTVLYVNSGTCQPGTEAGCEDEVGLGGETMTFTAPANTNYWVFVDGYNSGNGVATVRITIAP